MAYDDVLARVCYVFEIQTLLRRITSKELSDRYRSSIPFPEDLMEQLESAIAYFGESKNYSQEKFRFNKATLFSWFVFLLVANKKHGIEIDPELQAQILNKLENLRTKNLNKNSQVEKKANIEDAFLSDLFAIFEDRSRARVGNVDSVLIRDIMLWLVFIQVAEKHQLRLERDKKISKLQQEFSSLASSKNPSIFEAESFFYNIIEKENWGMRI